MRTKGPGRHLDQFEGAAGVTHRGRWREDMLRLVKLFF